MGEGAGIGLPIWLPFQPECKTHIRHYSPRFARRYCPETDCHPGYSAVPSEPTDVSLIHDGPSEAPAFAALVACPARVECPAYLANPPCPLTSFFTIRGYVVPDNLPG